jgi:hypothetical protein
MNIIRSALQRSSLILQDLGLSIMMLTLPGGYFIALTDLILRHWPLGSSAPK